MRSLPFGRWPHILVSTAVLALLAGAATIIAMAQTKPLQLVSTEWPPFTNTAGQSRFALDLVESAFSRIGVSSQTSFVEAAQFTSAVLTGPYDGSAAVWKDAARDKTLLFSEPYLENRLILIARSGGNVSAASLAALKGRAIAIVEGYAYGDAVDNAGPAFVRSKSEDDSLRMLLDRRVDFALMDALVVQYLVDAYPEEARTRLQIGRTPLATRQLHLALRRTLPEAQSIVTRFNAQIRQMITDRTYHKLLHVDWIRADVDGDGVSEYIGGSDRSGKAPPQNAYSLFSAASLDKQVKADQERYFFGGAVYNGWSAVPDRYKVDDLNRPDHTHPTARVFTFSWK